MSGRMVPDMKTYHSNERLEPDDVERISRGAAGGRWPTWLWRTSWRGGAVVGAALVLRYSFDTLVPTADYGFRTSALTYTIFGVCVFAGARGAWQTRSIRTGVLTSLSASTIGALFSIVGTGLLLAVWHDAATLDAWRSSGGLDEALVDVPLKVVVIGAVMGLAGAACGRAVARD